MLAMNGRKVKSIEEGEQFIREFMRETLGNPSESGYGKNYDFDLYLPWMMDWVLNVPQNKDDEDMTATHVLEVLFMDAGWSLCQKGILRPGPRSTGGESIGGALGKGYSLTPKGREWLNEIPPPPPAADHP